MGLTVSFDARTTQEFIGHSMSCYRNPIDVHDAQAVCGTQSEQHASTRHGQSTPSHDHLGEPSGVMSERAENAQIRERDDEHASDVSESAASAKDCAQEL